MNESSLNQYLSLTYTEARARELGVGRRRLKLQIISEFWRLPKTEKIEAVRKASSSPSSIVASSFGTDPDPYDIPGLADSTVVGTRGVVVRTHFEPFDEAAWATFLTSLEDLERRSLGSLADSQMDENSESESEGEEDDGEQGKTSSTAGQSEVQDTNMEEHDQSSAVNLTYENDAIFFVLDPKRQTSGQVPQKLLSGASNITLLRLFNDASIAPAPPLPSDAPKRIKPGHRLIDEDGFQEIYTGPRLWAWDQQSAKDQTLRLISSRVFVYGDATADSWRVRASHMWDLQINIDAGMRIDFSGGSGGGWNVNERERNLKDALL